MVTHLRQGAGRVSEQTLCSFCAGLIEQCSESRALVLQPALKGSQAYILRGGGFFFRQSVIGQAVEDRQFDLRWQIVLPHGAHQRREQGLIGGEDIDIACRNRLLKHSAGSCHAGIAARKADLGAKMLPVVRLWSLWLTGEGDGSEVARESRDIADRGQNHGKDEYLNEVLGCVIVNGCFAQGDRLGVFMIVKGS